MRVHTVETIKTYTTTYTETTMSDPRVFFAAERTMLAWMRSGLTVIALGFVVARFGLFLAVIAAASPGAAAVDAHRPHSASGLLGILLVLFGAGAILAALRNHQTFIRSLPVEDRPHLPMPWLTPFLCIAVAMLGFLLAGYLAIA